MTRRSKHVSFVIVPILYKTRDPKRALLIGGPELADHIHKDSMFTSFVVCASDHKYCRLLLLLCCTNNSKCNTGWYYLYLLNSINKMLGLTN